MAGPGAYATFGGLLTGFAFSGLSFYITRKHDRENDQPKIEGIAAVLFLAMVSLGICTFLYANLGVVANSNSGAAIMALLSYGIVFALSVLSLFYAVALMILENLPEKDAAKIAYWVVTVAGTVLVLRFLADTVHAAASTRCLPSSPCILPGVVSWQGISLTLLGAALLSVVCIIRLEEGEPRGVIGALTDHPIWPPGGVFIATVTVTTTESVYLSTRSPGYTPSELLIYSSYAISILSVALFALACGRVISPRAEVSVESLLHLGWAAKDPGAHEVSAQARKLHRSTLVRRILEPVCFLVVVALFFIGPDWYLAFSIAVPAGAVWLLVWIYCPQKQSNGSEKVQGMTTSTTGIGTSQP
jgi:hypothetical protein